MTTSGGLKGTAALLAAAAVLLTATAGNAVTTPGSSLAHGPVFTVASTPDGVTANQIGFTPIAPVRMVDTRPTNTVGGFAGRVGAATQSFTVTGRGVPATATAVVVNIIVVDPAGGGYLSLWPAGQPKPLVSTLNTVGHRTAANNATVQLGVNGQISVAMGATTAYVVIDVQGYYAPATGGAFVATPPARVIDTRDGTGGPKLAIQAGETRNYQLTGAPANTVGVVMNVTSVNASAGSYLTVWPKNTTKPGTSNLNVAPGRTVANLVTTGLSADGSFSVYNNAGHVDIAADVEGYIVSNGAGTFTPGAPQRTVDTRTATGTAQARTGPGQTITVNVGGTGADAVSLNVTGVNPTAQTYLTVWPAGQPKPATSNVNLMPGDTIPNAVTVAAAGGKVNIYNSAGNVDVVVDTVGRFTGTTTVTNKPSASSTTTYTQPAPTPAPAPAAKLYPTTGPGTASKYAINTYTDGSTIRWNPCQTIHWTADLQYAPAGALADLKQTFDMVSQATGIPFAYAGATTAIPQKSWTNTWPAGQSQMVIAWGRPSGQTGGTDILPGGSVVGVGGWIARGGGGSALQIVNGYAIFDANYKGLSAGFGANGEGQLLLHETGHAVGLNHTDEQVQQMYPMITLKNGVYGAGDLSGLKAVGKTNGCL